MIPRALHPTRRLGLFAACLLVFAAACDDVEPTAPAEDVEFARIGGPGHLSVYTQNVYLGGDTGPIFSIDFSDIPALMAATSTFWAEVQASDVAERMHEIANELDRRRPHLVGLQEVFQFVAVDLSTGAPVVTDFIDLLALLQGEIDARGLPYEVVAVQENTSTGSQIGLPRSPTSILQFTDRIAALRRTDVPVTAVDHANFAASAPLGPLTLERGWIRLAAEHRGEPVHFVTTHLEIQALAPLQAAQSAELLGSVMAGLEGTVVLAGDLNSDPENPGAPSWTPTYDDMIAAGFSDAWRDGRCTSRRPGYTCCQDPGLRNGPSALDRRLDFVLVKGAASAGNGRRGEPHLRAALVGARQRDRTATNGLWPSDHAGVWAALRVRSR